MLHGCGLVLSVCRVVSSRAGRSLADTSDRSTSRPPQSPSFLIGRHLNGGGGAMTPPAFVFGLSSSPPALLGAFVPLTYCNARDVLPRSRRVCAAGANNVQDTPDDEEKMQGVGLYVHIPYCRRRCRYCDFAIVPIGSAADDSTSRAGGSSTSKRKANDGFHKMDDAYRESLLAELDLIRRTTPNVGGRIPLRSIYFGGGTPSLAPTSTLRSILSLSLIHI